MRLSRGIFVILLLLAGTVQAQRARYGVVKGIVQDSAGRQAVEAATISVFLQKDSSLVNYVLTNRRGEFQVKDVPVGTGCRLLISYNGLRSHLQEFIIPDDKTEFSFGIIRLGKDVKELEQVMVVGLRPPMVIRKDTIEFNAGAFRTVPNAVLEDLIKQLPGIDVDAKGNLTMNGRKIQKITIDGKDYFGNDPIVALKNLPRNIIDKIQVVDNKSREAQFNKTTTGEEDKVLNLTLKKDQNQGWFGRISGGYGTEKRYEMNGNLNTFSPEKQISIIANGNNTNRGGFGGSSFSISNAQSSLGGVSPGFTDNKSAGVNFSKVFNKKLTLTSSYYFNRIFYENLTQTRSENLVEKRNKFYNSIVGNNNTNSAHRVNVNLEYKPDTMTSIYLNTSYNKGNNKSESTNDGRWQNDTARLVNTSYNTLNSSSDNDGISLDFFIGRRLRKEGRSVSLNIAYATDKSDGLDFNAGHVWQLKEDLTDSTSDINQRSKVGGRNNNFGIAATYSEPLAKNLTALFRYNYRIVTGNNEKLTQIYNPSTKQYDLTDPNLTDVFTNRADIHNPGVSLNYFKTDRYRASAGMSMQWLRQKNTSLIQSEMDQKYLNYFPTAQFVWQVDRTSEFGFYYIGSSIQPSAQQLRPVPDNSNPLLVMMGNPDLKPAFTHNLNMNFRQTKGQLYWFGGLNFVTTSNQISNETDYDLGKQIMRPININGNYNLNGSLTMSKTWKSRALSFRLNTTLIGGVSQDKTVVRKVKVGSTTNIMSARILATATYKELINFMPSYNIMYNNTRYSSGGLPNASAVNHTATVDLFINWPKRLIIENSIMYVYNSNIAPGFKKSITSWNAGAMVQLFKDNRAAVRLAVYDILRENSSVTRTITNTVIQDVQVQVLQQYYMLSFMYNIQRFSGGKKK